MREKAGSSRFIDANEFLKRTSQREERALANVDAEVISCLREPLSFRRRSITNYETILGGRNF